MMLRLAVSKVLFNRHIKELTNKEIDVCNEFIDNYNKVEEIVTENW